MTCDQRGKKKLLPSRNNGSEPLKRTFRKKTSSGRQKTSTKPMCRKRLTAKGRAIQEQAFRVKAHTRLTRQANTEGNTPRVFCFGHSAFTRRKTAQNVSRHGALPASDATPARAFPVHLLQQSFGRGVCSIPHEPHPVRYRRLSSPVS